MKTDQPFLNRFLATLLGIVSLLLAETASAADGTWTGASSAVWATAGNWTGGVPGTGNTATFNSAGNGNTTIDLGAGVTVKTNLFNTASVAAYTIGSGAVGSQTLTLNDSGAIQMTSTVANNQLFNAAITLGTATAASYTITNDSANTLTLAGRIGGGNGGTAGAKTLTIGGAGNIVISDILTNGGASSVVLTKTGAGTLTLSGTNTYSGATTVRAGTVTISGNRTAASGAISVGVDSNLATLNLQAGNFSLGANGLAVGNGAVGTNGIVNHSAGAVSYASGNAVLVGNGAVAGVVGVYNLSGGSITGFSSATRGIILGVNPGCAGVFNLSGTGNLNLPTGALVIARQDSAAINTSGTFNQTGGTAIVNTLRMGSISTSSGGKATLNLLGGTFTNNSFTALSAGTSDVSTIMIGGTADVTLPAFPTVRGSGSTATITFNGGTLRSSAASAAYMSGLNNAYLTVNGANFNLASGKDITIAQVFENAPSQTGVLTKSGLGTLTLSGANLYSGVTTISNGILRVNGSLTGAAMVQPGGILGGNGAVNGAVTVNHGGSVTAGDAAGTGNLTLGSLTLGASGSDAQTINLTLIGMTVTAVSLTGALVNNGTTTINVSSSGTVLAGTYTLITYSGPTITSGFVLGSKPPGSTLQYGAGSISLVVTDSLKWTGATSGTWDITSTNWQWISAANAANYVEGTAVLFDDTLTGNPGITLNTTVLPGGMTFNHDATAYSLSGSGSVAGTGVLLKSGVGTLTIANANTYSGGTTISGGTLEANNNSALGSGLVTMIGGTLSNSVGGLMTNNLSLSSAGIIGVSSGNTLTLSGMITNTGALAKVGSGALTLSGVNTYGGATTVSNGTLNLSGNHAANCGAITVGVDANLATLNLQQGSYPLGGNSFTVSTGTAGVGTNSIVNQSGGDISFTGGNAVLVGGVGIVTSDINNVGVYNMSGGSITGFSSGTRGVILGVNAGCSGIFNLSGTGSLNLTNGALIIARRDSTANNTSGTFTQTGGSAIINTLAMGSANANSGGKATLTLIGGTFTNNSFTALSAGISDTSTITIGGTADVTLPALPTARGSGSTATITFDGGTLHPAAASTSYISNMTAAYLTANGANLKVDSGKDITIAQVLDNAPSQTGILTKAGAGTLTLSGVNTYGGMTTISNGTLRVSGSLSGGATIQTGTTLAGNGVVSGAVTVNSGGSLVAGDITGVGNLTLGSLTLGAAGGDTQTVTVKPDSSYIIVTGALANNGVTTINFTNVGVLLPGPHPLITYSGPMITSGFVLGSPSAGTLQYHAGSIDLVIPDAPKWSGATSAVWDTTTTNWLLISAGTPTKYVDGNPVLFDDTLTANPDVTLNTTVNPDGVIFANDVAAYSLNGTGGIAGTNGLTKKGAGLLALGNANTYSGGTTLLGTGMLALTNGSALGTGTLNLKSARTDNLPTIVLSGTITVTNPVVMDSTTGRESFYSTNGNNTLTGPITLTGTNINHLLFQNDGDPGTRFTVSNSISGPAFAGAISLRGASNALGLVAGQVTINSSFQINGGANWTVSSTNNLWTQTLIQGENGSLILGATDALAIPARVTWNSGTAGALDLAGYNQTVAGLECSTAPTYPSLGVGNSSTTTDSLLKIDGGSYTFAGRLMDGIGAGTRKLSLEVVSGTQTLTGDNTYSGTTTISGGTLNIGAGGTVGSISNTPSPIINNGSLSFNRSDAFVVTNEINGSGNLTLAAAVIARPANGSALGAGTITIGTLQPDTCRVELTGGITLSNTVTFRSRAYPATFPPHILNVSGTNVLNPPADITLAVGGNVISLESDSGRLVLTKGVTSSQSAPRYLAVQGAGDGEVQGALSGTMALYKGGAGAWTLLGSSSMGGPTLVNNGTLVLKGSLTAPGNQVTVDGGTLAGSGTIAGPVTVAAAGTLAPGTSLGTLTINNDLTLQGAAVMEIARNGAVLTKDQIAGVNTLTYGGTLIVTKIGGSALQVGDSFKLFAATNYSSVFANIVYPAGYTFTDTLAADGTITVLTAPTGGSPTLSYTPSGGNWVFTWSGSFKLQTQTNSLAVGLSTNWADVPGGNTSGVSVPAPVSGNPAVFFRLISTP